MQRYYNNSYFPNYLHAFLLVFNALCFGVGAAECVGASLYLVEVGLLEWLYAVLVDGDFEAGAGVAAGAYEVGLCGVGVDCVGKLCLQFDACVDGGGCGE